MNHASLALESASGHAQVGIDQCRGLALVRQHDARPTDNHTCKSNTCICSLSIRRRLGTASAVELHGGFLIET